MICPWCGYRHGSFSTFWNAEDMLDGISEFDLDDEMVCDVCSEDCHNNDLIYL